MTGIEREEMTARESFFTRQREMPDAHWIEDLERRVQEHLDAEAIKEKHMVDEGVVCHF